MEGSREDENIAVEPSRVQEQGVSKMSKRNLVSGALIAALFTVLAGTDAWAIPAFARKYQTRGMSRPLLNLVG